MKIQSLFFALIFVLTPLFNLQGQDDLIQAFQQSYELESESSYTKAINVIKEHYAADHYEINLRLGWLHYSAGRFTDALTYYNRCIELRPMSIEAKLGYALPASALGHWEQVKTQYESILEIDPNHSLTNYRLGLIYYGREQYDRAEKYFQKVVNLYPFDYDSLLMLAWTKYFLGKTGEAKLLFHKVLLYNPGDESATQGLEGIK